MVQILNITQLRNNISSIISEVGKSRKPVIIIRDSNPEAVVISYKDYQTLEKQKEAKILALIKKNVKIYQNEKQQGNLQKLNDIEELFE